MKNERYWAQTSHWREEFLQKRLSEGGGGVPNRGVGCSLGGGGKGTFKRGNQPGTGRLGCQGSGYRDKEWMALVGERRILRSGVYKRSASRGKDLRSRRKKAV